VAAREAARVALPALGVDGAGCRARPRGRPASRIAEAIRCAISAVGACLLA
jgi:hypothetical protein